MNTVEPYDDDERGPIWAALDLAGWPNSFDSESVRELMAAAIDLDRQDRQEAESGSDEIKRQHYVEFADLLKAYALRDDSGVDIFVQRHDGGAGWIIGFEPHADTENMVDAVIRGADK